jgi:hypothetical protein
MIPETCANVVNTNGVEDKNKSQKTKLDIFIGFVYFSALK